MRNSNPDEDNYMLQVDPREEFKCPYVYQANYSMSVDTSQQPPPSIYTHQLMVPPQTSPAHLYQLSYFPNQTITQNSPPLLLPPAPNTQQANTVMYYPYSSMPMLNQYSPYIQSTVTPMQYQNTNPQSESQQGPPHQYFTYPLNHSGNQIRSPPQEPRANMCSSINFQQIHHFTCVYRVGLLVLDTLARRVHEPNQAKYSRNLPFREEIQWLLHQKLYQLSSSDYEEYVRILYFAYGAFAMTPEGGTMFKDWLQSVRRSKSCKKRVMVDDNKYTTHYMTLVF